MPAIEVLFLGIPDGDVAAFESELRLIESKLSFRKIASLSALEKTLSTNRQQLVIAGAAGCDALAAIEACRRVSLAIPLVAVFNSLNEELAARLVRAGARDCFLKHQRWRLTWAVQREIAQFERDRRLSESMDRTLDLAPDAIIAISAERRIVMFNKAAEKIFGYTFEEIDGKPLDTLIPSRFHEAHKGHVADFENSGVRSRNMDSRGRVINGLRKDGSEFPVEVSIAAMKEAGSTVFLAVVRDITEKRRVAEQIEYLATHDSVTGLANRNVCIDRLSHAMALTEREENLLAFLYIDIDDFKRVNDTLGHAAGDELLREIARRIQRGVRKSDTVARLGGDEFAVILEQMASVEAVGDIAGKIIALLREPVTLAKGKAEVSASIGITVFPFDSHTAEQVVSDADVAMYVAKNAGKNRFQFYSAEFSNIDIAELSKRRA